jgi:6-phosphofructokinase 1
MLSITLANLIITWIVNDICNKEKKFPAEWITAEGTDISDEYIKYVRPLIQGTNIAEYSDGVPVHL